MKVQEMSAPNVDQFRIIEPLTSSIFLFIDGAETTYSSRIGWKPLSKEIIETLQLEPLLKEFNLTNVLCDGIEDINALTVLSEPIINSAAFISLPINGSVTSNTSEPTISHKISFNDIVTLLPDKELTDEQVSNLDCICHELSIDIIIPSLKHNNTNCDLYILGKECKVLAAKHHVLALLDVMKSTVTTDSKRTRLKVDTLELNFLHEDPVPLDIHPATIQYVKSTYKTNIYQPHLNDGNLLDKEKTIYLSSEVHSFLPIVKKMLMDILKSRTPTYYKSLSGISPGKLRYIRRFCRETVDKITLKFQCSIYISSEKAEFCSTSKELLILAIRYFTIHVLQQITEIQLIFDDNSTIDDQLLEHVLHEDLIIVQDSQQENQLLIIGNHTTKSTDIIEKLIKIFASSDLSKYDVLQWKAIFELDPSFEEFISGKKNGKLTRILDANHDSLLKLERLKEDERLFLHLIHTSSLTNFQTAFNLVLNELPAEDSFYIPELYHRPVIGSGGSIIQTTMRKHNVFIQFSNSFLLPQEKSSLIRYDNVIIRCPFKNHNNIIIAKNDLINMVDNFGSMQTIVKVHISLTQYRFLLSNYGGSIIGTLEKAHNVYIMFPLSVPTDNFVLTIKGMEENPSKAATDLINSYFGFEMEIKMTKNFTEESLSIFENQVIANFDERFNAKIAVLNKSILITYNKESADSLQMLLKDLSNYAQWRKADIVSRNERNDFIIHEDVISKNEETYSPVKNSYVGLMQQPNVRLSIPNNSIDYRQYQYPNFNIDSQSPTKLPFDYTISNNGKEGSLMGVAVMGQQSQTGSPQKKK